MPFIVQLQKLVLAQNKFTQKLILSVVPVLIQVLLIPIQMKKLMMYMQKMKNSNIPIHILNFKKKNDY